MITPVELHLLRWGRPGSARRILLLHGLTSAAGTWWQVADLLAAHDSWVTAADLRGHGASPRTVSYELAAYGADVRSISAAMGVGEVRSPAVPPWDLVIGHSLGGAVAVTVAAAHPDWAGALLLLDPVIALSDDDADAVVDDNLSSLQSVPAERLRHEHPRWHDEDIEQKVLAARVVSPHVVQHSIRDNQPWDLRAPLARLSVPTLVLGADPLVEEPSFTTADAAALKCAGSTARFAVVAGASHSIHREDPQQVLRAALTLLQP